MKYALAEASRLPFDVKAPNSAMRKAIAELDAGQHKKSAGLMADLYAGD
ncbi:DNA-damage-inducible protein J [Mycoavidus cysteinexigens]|uniref:DNA-damage-inducible protein J n=1 Tax=Mycoavidus cysteinexigens TaxID=1553431 RepID=A0A2Z6EYG9_9BURK|nr:hypothetical protein [Mycoavidus cysteinexigens]BBE10477.1 DNA-damage-inducible protein J [Mycoavidus cysteinexigens]GAM53141.1 hypothetical protein EBME_1604 [bacterium endosymbiont of Mortierella elongata FMR23-6]GLR01839.1 hypothetical protein GCM10007934_16510 [Mycoavidus cysteinexigens]